MVYYRYSNFNSHAHVERDSVKYVYDFLDLYFNSHAHVERDILKITQKNQKVISTHTLTWSVTPLIVVI